jgi:hypothetical protein
MQSQQKTILKSRKWSTGMFLGGIVLVVFGLYQTLTMPEGTPGNLSGFSLSAGVVLMILAGARMLRGGEYYLQDERTRRIGAYGLSYSWFLTFLALFALFWVNYLGLASPDPGAISVFFILLMGLSAKAFQWWFFRKEDVE